MTNIMDGDWRLWGELGMPQCLELLRDLGRVRTQRTEEVLVPFLSPVPNTRDGRITLCFLRRSRHIHVCINRIADRYVEL